MNYKLPSTHISKASLLFALGMASSVANVYAENTPAAAEEIVVTGMRAALDKAIDVKQTNDHVMEALSLDDINATPAVTIAEALVRLPGINGARDRGNESQAAIRGLGPRMVFSTLNGREVASSEPGRAVRYEQYPSEMMSAVEVYKTQSADMVEGGIAGTINLKTLSPLNYTGSEAIIRAGIQNNDGGKEIPDYSTLGNRMSASFVHHFSDSFAASFGVSSQKQKNGFESLQGEEWNGLAPKVLRVEVKEEVTERTGMVSSLEFKPNENLDIQYDILYTKVGMNENGPTTQYSLWDDAKAFTNVKVKNGVTVAGSIPWAGATHTIADYFQDSNALTQGLKFNYTGIEGLKIAGDISASKAELEHFWNGIAFSETNQNLSWDLEGDSPSIVVAPGSSALKPEASVGKAQFAWDGHDGGHLTDKLYSAKLDFKKAIEAGDLDAIDFGVRTSSREKGKRHVTLANWQAVQASPTLPSNYFKSFSVDAFTASPVMYAPSYTDLATKLYGSVDKTTKEDDNNYWNVEETNSAIYVKADLKGDIAGFDYDGNIGVRQVKIGTKSAGFLVAVDYTKPVLDANGNPTYEWAAGPTWPAGPQVFASTSTLTKAPIDYNFTLPSASINISLDETKKLRIAAARAISRPPLDELKSGTFLSLSTGGNSGDAGNPYLKPYTSDQVDVSYEWYFAKESLAAASVFYKDINDYIGISTIGTFTAPARQGRPESKYTINGPINGDGGYVRGFELTFQMPFDFLPVEGFGVYSNYSHAESNIMEFTPANKPYTMAGLAKHSGVVDLWYSAHGFDARLGWKYTSAYTSAFTWNGGDLTKLDPETSLGFSVSYEFNEHVSARIQLNNLTNQDARLSKFNNDSALARDDFYGRSMLADVTWKL